MKVGMKCLTFFDTDTVMRRVGAARHAVLSRFGAYVRQQARGSMRRSKTPSKPGQPPHAHAGQLKTLLFFSYDIAADSVVIGPTPFRGPALVPRLLEEGGAVVLKNQIFVPKEAVDGYVRDALGRFAKHYKRIPAGATLHYPPHPYMGPAMYHELPKLPKLWKDKIR
jgi:hypothetical protein